MAADGTFEFTYVAEPGAKTMIVREVFNDWDTEERGTAHHRAPDTIDQPAKPLTEAMLRKKYEVAAAVARSARSRPGSRSRSSSSTRSRSTP